MFKATRSSIASVRSNTDQVQRHGPEVLVRSRLFEHRRLDTEQLFASSLEYGEERSADRVGGIKDSSQMLLICEGRLAWSLRGTNH